MVACYPKSLGFMTNCVRFLTDQDRKLYNSGLEFLRSGISLICMSKEKEASSPQLKNLYTM